MYLDQVRTSEEFITWYSSEMLKYYPLDSDFYSNENSILSVAKISKDLRESKEKNVKQTVFYCKFQEYVDPEFVGPSVDIEIKTANFDENGMLMR